MPHRSQMSQQYNGLSWSTMDFANKKWNTWFFQIKCPCMETNVEFGNLIPRKFSFWREIFAILRGTHHLDGYFGLFDNIPGKFCIFSRPANSHHKTSIKVALSCKILFSLIVNAWNEIQKYKTWSTSCK